MRIDGEKRLLNLELLRVENGLFLDFRHSLWFYGNEIRGNSNPFLPRIFDGYLLKISILIVSFYLAFMSLAQLYFSEGFHGKLLFLPDSKVNSNLRAAYQNPGVLLSNIKS